MNKSMVLNTILSATAGGVIGGVVTYLTVKNSLKKAFDQELKEQVEDVKRHYALIRKDDGSVQIYGSLSEEERAFTPEEFEEQKRKLKEHFESGRRIMEEEGYSPTPDDFETGENATPLKELPETDGLHRGRVWDNEDPTPDPDYEVIEGEPYLITVESFMNDYRGEHDKATLTYYEGDNTLLDENEQAGRELPDLVGVRHLHMFGRKSGDKNIVYVRNEKISTDFEIFRREEGYYETLFGGESTEPVKSNRQRVTDDD